jgi:hypothetical protein
MRIFNRLRAKTMAVSLAICLCVTPAFPKDKIEVVPRGNWGAVEFLEKGTSISVAIDFGNKIEGKFLELDAGAIRLMVDKKERVYPRASITEIRQFVPDSNLDGILIGYLAGAGAGGLIAKASGTLNTGDSAARQIGGAIIAVAVVLGAVAGGVIDSRTKGKSKLIYLK